MKFKNCETCQYNVSTDCALPQSKRSKEWEEFIDETSIRKQIYPNMDCPTWKVDRELLDKAKFLIHLGLVQEY